MTIKESPSVFPVVKVEQTVSQICFVGAAIDAKAVWLWMAQNCYANSGCLRRYFEITPDLSSL